MAHQATDRRTAHAAVGLHPMARPAMGPHPMVHPAMGLHPMAQPAMGLHPMAQPAMDLHPTALPATGLHPMARPAMDLHRVTRRRHHPDMVHRRRRRSITGRPMAITVHIGVGADTGGDRAAERHQRSDQNIARAAMNRSLLPAVARALSMLAVEMCHLRGVIARP
jgi:hypothetical protein